MCRNPCPSETGSRPTEGISNAMGSVDSHTRDSFVPLFDDGFNMDYVAAIWLMASRRNGSLFLLRI